MTLYLSNLWAFNVSMSYPVILLFCFPTLIMISTLTSNAIGYVACLCACKGLNAYLFLVQYLDENKQLILAILDNQNLGKLSECAQ